MRRIYYNSWLAKCFIVGYSTAMFFGYICTKNRPDKPLSARLKRHESIHAEQYGEVTLLAFLLALLLQAVLGGSWWFAGVPFVYYVLYFLEASLTWCFRLVTDGWKSAARMAYEYSMFEQEVRAGEGDVGYVESRRFCAFLRYFGRI